MNVTKFPIYSHLEREREREREGQTDRQTDRERENREVRELEIIRTPLNVGKLYHGLSLSVTERTHHLIQIPILRSRTS